MRRSRFSFRRGEREVPAAGRAAARDAVPVRVVFVILFRLLLAGVLENCTVLGLVGAGVLKSLLKRSLLVPYWTLARFGPHFFETTEAAL